MGRITKVFNYTLIVTMFGILLAIFLQAYDLNIFGQNIFTTTGLITVFLFVLDYTNLGTY